jgi:hypothetical protein
MSQARGEERTDLLDHALIIFEIIKIFCCRLEIIH